jgi:hypothetical protein
MKRYKAHPTPKGTYIHVAGGSFAVYAALTNSSAMLQMNVAFYTYFPFLVSTRGKHT